LAEAFMLFVFASVSVFVALAGSWFDGAEVGRSCGCAEGVVGRGISAGFVGTGVGTGTGAAAEGEAVVALAPARVGRSGRAGTGIVSVNQRSGPGSSVGL